MAGGKHILGKGNSKRVFGPAKVGEKGQIVIPKEAREMFNIQPGDSLHVNVNSKNNTILDRVLLRFPI